jgi:hypothetical protein
VISGEGGVFYLYAQGFFGWGPVEYSLFLTINTVVHLVGKYNATNLATFDRLR